MSPPTSIGQDVHQETAEAAPVLLKINNTQSSLYPTEAGKEIMDNNKDCIYIDKILLDTTKNITDNANKVSDNQTEAQQDKAKKKRPDSTIRLLRFFEMLNVVPVLFFKMAGDNAVYLVEEELRLERFCRIFN
ncbi:hypothetical protein SK128_005445 [Halocaridina rubra]|uniref:Uncharacterized protein n=1 Tax=Halocaridina rubra TaxID=373956 RepID=A0AAN8ZV62_HALRR